VIDARRTSRSFEYRTVVTPSSPTLQTGKLPASRPIRRSIEVDVDFFAPIDMRALT